MATHKLVATSSLQAPAAALASEVVAGCSGLRTASASTADALAASAEESFHTVHVCSVLDLWWLGLARAVVDVVRGRRLQRATVVAETSLGAIHVFVGLDRLDLVFKGVVDALALVDRVVQTFGARDRLHRDVRAQRHALVDVARRWQRVGPLGLGVPAPATPRVPAAVETVLTRLLHGRKLQFLVVEIVRFFASVAFSVARKLFVQMDSTRTFRLARAEGAAF